MVVGAMEVELHVHASRSLKEKRSVIRSIVRARPERVPRRGGRGGRAGHLAVGGARAWPTVGHDAVSVRAILERVVDFIESLHLAEVRDQSIAVLEGTCATTTRRRGDDDEDATETTTTTSDDDPEIAQ